MTKETKIAALASAMTRSTRDDGTEFYHFADGDEKTFEAIKELKDLYLEHYEVRDIDYEIFSRACYLVLECYADNDQEKDGMELIEDMIYERAPESASIYNEDRLAYLNIYNDEEIGQVMREYSVDSIADACAIWYDRQFEQAAIIINEWVNA